MCPSRVEPRKLPNWSLTMYCTGSSAGAYIANLAYSCLKLCTPTKPHASGQRSCTRSFQSLLAPATLHHLWQTKPLQCNATPSRCAKHVASSSGASSSNRHGCRPQCCRSACCLYYRRAAPARLLLWPRQLASVTVFRPLLAARQFQQAHTTVDDFPEKDELPNLIG